MSCRSAILFLAGAVLLFGQDAAKVVVPHRSWNCGMAEGIPSPESGSPIFSVEVKLDRIADIGKTPYGNRRVAVGQRAPYLARSCRAP